MQHDEETAPAGELSLTAVELQVLRAMAQGLSNQAIADDQQRTINTVRTHVSSILKKLGAASRGEAVAMARRRESRLSETASSFRTSVPAAGSLLVWWCPPPPHPRNKESPVLHALSPVSS